MTRIRIFLSLAAVLWATLLYAQREPFRRNPPSPEPLQQLKLPPIETAVLSNRLSVSVVYRDDIPFISLQLVVFAGMSFSPERSPGMAIFAAQMLGRGSLIHSASEFQEIVDSVGGTFSVSVNPDYVLVSFHFLEEYLDQALQMVGEMLLQSNFSEREIASARLRVTYDLSEKDKDPEFVGQRHLNRLLFDHHPYAKGSFTREAIRTWNLKDLQDFFGRTYRPNNAHMILTGSLNLRTAVRKVSTYLNLWQPQEISANLVPLAFAPEKPRLCLVDVPQTQESVIYMGTSYPLPGIPEYFDLKVLNQVLGGTLNSRLFMNLRESKAFAKFAFSETAVWAAGGAFIIRANVRPEVAAASIREIKKEIEGMASLSSEEIEQAKAYLIGHFPLEIESFEDFSLKIADIKARGAGDESWDTYYERVSLVNAERAVAAAKKYLFRPFLIVVAGDKNRLADQLAEIDSIEVFDNKGQFLTTVNRKGAADEARGMRPEFQRRPRQK